MSATNKFDTRGRKRKIETVDAFRAAVMQYHKECEEANNGEGIFPDPAGLRLFLKKTAGITKADLKAMSEGDSEFAQGIRDILDEAQDMRESWLARKMTSDNKRAIGCLNALKQPGNGGYIDKAVDTGERTLTINVAGIKGGAKAFK
jgi:hypothetical protein